METEKSSPSSSPNSQVMMTSASTQGRNLNMESTRPKEETPSQDGVSSQDELDLEVLGRQRPAVFSSTLQEVLFCSSLLVSMLMAEFFISGFNIILPSVSHSLAIPASHATWPASVFSLVTGSFLLPLGRLADIYGAYPLFTAGLTWFTLFSLLSGFSPSYPLLITFRALAGFGPAAFLPTSIMLIGKHYRPGPRKNLVFSLYSAFAPIGFFIGIIVGGATTQMLSWRWYFWIGSAVLALVAVTGFVTVPNDTVLTQTRTRRDNGSQTQEVQVKMDWWGLITIVPGVACLTFAVTDGAHAPNGFNTPYVIATAVLGAVFLVAAVYVEGWVAEQPLLPFDLFKPKYMGRLSVSLFFAYGVFGVYLFYASLHISTFMGNSALTTAVWFTPMAVGGMILATIGGFTLHLLPGRVLLIISGLGNLVSVLLFALIPEEGGNYWAFVFPAMLGCTIGVDITYLVSNIFITTNVPRHRQGLAGALINTLLFLGISVFLGFADLAVSEDQKRNPNGQGHRVAFWFATACAVIALGLFATIDLGKAESDLTVEEREAKQTQSGTATPSVSV